jgi:hypothetical protein
MEKEIKQWVRINQIKDSKELSNNEEFLNFLAKLFRFKTKEQIIMSITRCTNAFAFENVEGVVSCLSTRLESNY